MFKKTHSFNERYQGSLRLLQKYPDSIPIIVEKKYKIIVLNGSKSNNKNFKND